MSLRTVVAPLLLWALAAGCSSTTVHRRPTSSGEAAQILSGPDTRNVELVVKFPQGTELRRGTLAPFDAHRFIITEPSGRRSTVTFQQTHSIAYKETGKGAMVGLLIGAIPGFLLGFAAGHSLGSCGPFWDKCTDNAVPAGIGFGLAGGLLTGGIGAAIGAALGPRNTIVF